MSTIRQAMRALRTASDDARMIEHAGHWVTWGEVRSIAEAIDETLASADAGEGSRIGVVLGNTVESVAALVSLLGSGRTVVTLNPMQPVSRIRADLLACRPSAVLAPRSLWDDDEFVSGVAELGADGFAVDEEMARVLTGPGHPTGSSDSSVAIEMSTSGTTGPPKRIPLRWTQLDSAMSAVHGHVGTDATGRAPLTGRVALVTLALVHIGGMWSVLQALTEARPFVLLPRFTVDGWVGAVETHRPRIASLPPAAMRSVLDADVPAERISSLRAVTAGTTFVSPDLADEFIDRYGIPVLIVYGATEFSGAVAGWTKPMHGQWWSAKRGSVGRPFPGVSLRIVGERGDVLGTDEVGRLQVQASQTGSGVDGWVQTSDLAHIDADGFLFIDGRADDAIVRGGFKIQPEVVANALRAHSSVLDATVYGRDDPRLGQVPIAVVELTTGAAATDESELKQFLRDHLTPYEVPVSIYEVDALPRSPSLKVDRRRLIELVADREAHNA